MAIVRREEVIDGWSILMGAGQGRAEEIFGNTDDFITETKTPNVKKERKKLAPGVIRGLFGAKRDFLVVAEAGNKRLKPYQMFIGVRDYGSNLDISWYLTYRPGLLKDTRKVMPRFLLKTKIKSILDSKFLGS